MKHLIIPIIVLLVILGIGSFESICLYSTFKKLESRVDHLIDLANQRTLTINDFETFEEYWRKVHIKSEFFLPHSDVYEITLRVSEVKAYVIQKDYQLCIAHFGVIKELCQYVGRIALPSLGHIF
ncbi:MAG: DUF4363 family protein [Clostridia bacterium]|nr:DUF4363 family protein [Clostridia bacterium]